MIDLIGILVADKMNLIDGISYVKESQLLPKKKNKFWSEKQIKHLQKAYPIRIKIKPHNAQDQFLLKSLIFILIIHGQIELTVYAKIFVNEKFEANEFIDQSKNQRNA